MRKHKVDKSVYQLVSAVNFRLVRAMPATGSTPEIVSPKRAHLMATAWRLFYRDGYRAVGIDTLLAEAGVAKMTLYHHFAAKEDLIIAVLEKRDREIQAGLQAAVEAAGRSSARRLLAVFDWLDGWFATDDFKGCAFIRALSEYPERDHPIHQAAWRHKQAVIGMLTGLSDAAGAKAPAALAETLSLLIDGAIVAAHATGSTAPCASARAAAVSLLKLATA